MNKEINDGKQKISQEASTMAMPQQYLMKDPYDTYREQNVNMAGSVELIIMLYDGCKKNLVLAKRAIDIKHNTEAAHNYLIKAQNIVNELVNSLDMSFSISRELMAIYEFLLHEMIRINTSKDTSGMDPLLEIIDDLRETWREVDRLQKSNKLYVEGEDE